MSKVFRKHDPVNFPFRVFTLAVFVIAILPSLVQDGMFIDGIQYAVVSKNLANGLGTFWFPHISQNWNIMGSNVFLENPPLVYGIQSLFFRIFGDSLYTERIYCLFTALVSAYFIVRIWYLATGNNKELQKLGWLPVLIWVSMPVVFRSYQMNVQENTMGIFILASVYFVLIGLGRHRYGYLYVILAGVFIFLATLCKGVPGLFPLVAVAMYWLSGGTIKIQKAIVFSLILLSVPVLLYVLLLLNENAYESFSFYYKARLLERIHHDPVVNSRFYIVFRLLLDLLPGIVVTSLLAFIRRKKVSLSKFMEEKTRMVFFLLMGLAGSLPLAATLVQREFYLAPSLPFFSLAFSLIVAIYLADVLKQFSEKTSAFGLFRGFSVALLIGGIVYTGFQIGKTGRDQDILHDTYLFGEIMEEGSRIHLEAQFHPEDFLKHWNLELYLARYFNISLGAPIEDCRYLVFYEDGSPPDENIFELIPLDVETYSLYRRRNEVRGAEKLY